MTKSLPTWVFVAGPYRTASTTQYLMTEKIVEATNSGKGIGYHTEAKLAEFDVEGNKPYIVCKVFQWLPEGFQAPWADEPGPSHGAKIHAEGRMMSVVSIRDPRDMIVSMKKRRGDDFDFQQIATVDFPKWLGDAVKWIYNTKSHWSRFEDFTQHLLREVRAIARHLQVDLSDEAAKDIAKSLTVQEQQKRQEERKKAKPEEREHPWLPSIPGIVFGTSGHHKTWLTASEVKMVEEANREFMERFGYL